MQELKTVDDGAPYRALVTGGAGFIGSHLAEALLARGHEVTIVDDLSTGRLRNVAHLAHHPRFRWVVDSILNDGVLDPLVGACDVVFHLAAAVGVALIVRDPLHAIETNVLGTRAVLKSAHRHGKKVLIASTSEIYGKTDRVPFREDDDRLLGPTTKPRWSYAASKAVDEFLALAYHEQLGLPVVIFRLFNTVGPRQTGQYGMVIPRFVQQALRGEALTVYEDGQQSRCFCDVQDVVRAIVDLAASPSAVGQVFNVGSTAETTILNLARLVLDLTAERRLAQPPDRALTKARSNDDRIAFLRYETIYDVGFEDMRRRIPDVSKVRATIGWEPRIPLDETLRRVIAYFQDEIHADSDEVTANVVR